MLEEMLMNAHGKEVDAAARTIEQRMALEEFSRVERLERAIEKARTHIHWGGGVTTVGSHR
ncbi:hypothetical protein J0H33_03815 [bacterium]|jgi:hypothetical protein|nr:hypothetical protein [bacterium]